MADLAPALADRARRLRGAGRRVKDIAAELGVSIHDIKRATTPGSRTRRGSATGATTPIVPPSAPAMPTGWPISAITTGGPRGSRSPTPTASRRP